MSDSQDPAAEGSTPVADGGEECRDGEGATEDQTEPVATETARDTCEVESPKTGGDDSAETEAPLSQPPPASETNTSPCDAGSGEVPSNEVQQSGSAAATLVSAETVISESLKETHSSAASETFISSSISAVESESVTSCISTSQIVTNSVSEVESISVTTSCASEIESSVTTTSLSEVQSKSVTSSVSVVESKSVTSSVSEAESKSVTSSVFETESKSVTSSVSEAEPKSVTSSVSEAELKSVTSSVSEAELKSVPSSVSEAESKSVTSSVPEAESKSVTSSVPEAESKSVTSSVPEAESKSVTSSVPEAESKSVSSSVSEVESKSSSISAIEASATMSVSKAEKKMFHVTKFTPKPFDEVPYQPDIDFTFTPFIPSPSKPDATSTVVSQDVAPNPPTTATANDIDVAPNLPTEIDKAPEPESQPPVDESNQITESNETQKRTFTHKIYEPPPESEMEVTTITRKKKMFSSSSFYEEPNAIYPTVEEQVQLCRKIAGSLSDNTNLKSRGANMFFKRVKRAEKWVHEAPDFRSAGERTDDGPTSDPSTKPYIKVSKDPPKLKLILDPRQLKDMKLLRQEGFNINEHTAVSPEICLDLVRDLHTTTGRGGQLFARRKKKSEEWVVDEAKVKALLAQRQTPEPPKGRSSWEAEQNYVGTYVDVHPGKVAETVIKAAESKLAFPPPQEPPPLIPPPPFTPKPPQVSAPAPPPVPAPALPPGQVPQFKPSLYCADPYKPRAPRGWSGPVSGGAVAPQVSFYTPLAGQTLYEATISQPMYHTTESSVPPPSAKSFPVSRQYSFQNFNKVAKPWFGPTAFA